MVVESRQRKDGTAAGRGRYSREKVKGGGGGLLYHIISYHMIRILRIKTQGFQKEGAVVVAKR